MWIRDTAIARAIDGDVLMWADYKGGLPAGTPTIADASWPAMFDPICQIVRRGPVSPDPPPLGAWPDGPNYLGPLTLIDPETVVPDGSSLVGDARTLNLIPLISLMHRYGVMIGNAGWTMLEARSLGLPYIAIDRGYEIERSQASLFGVPYVKEATTVLIDQALDEGWSDPSSWGIPAAAEWIRNRL